MKTLALKLIVLIGLYFLISNAQAASINHSESDTNTFVIVSNVSSPTNQHAIRRHVFEMYCPLGEGNISTYAAASLEDTGVVAGTQLGFSVMKDDTVFYRDAGIGGTRRAIISNNGIGRYVITVQIANTTTGTAIPTSYRMLLGCYNPNTGLTVPGTIVSQLLP